MCGKEVKLVGPDGTALGVQVTNLGQGNGEAYHLEVRPVSGGQKQAFMSAAQIPHTRGVSKEMHASDTEKVEIWAGRMGNISSERMRHLPSVTSGAPKILESLQARKPGVLDEAKIKANFPRGKTLVNKAGPLDGEWANDIWAAGCTGVLTGARYIDFFWGIGNSVIISYFISFFRLFLFFFFFFSRYPGRTDLRYHQAIL